MVYSPLLDQDAPPYEATIEFTSRADWTRDLRALFAAIAPDGDTSDIRLPEDDTPAGAL